MCKYENYDGECTVSGNLPCEYENEDEDESKEDYLNWLRFIQK